MVVVVLREKGDTELVLKVLHWLQAITHPQNHLTVSPPDWLLGVSTLSYLFIHVFIYTYLF